jgi:hypothetical protein
VCHPLITTVKIQDYLAFHGYWLHYNNGILLILTPGRGGSDHVHGFTLPAGGALRALLG